MYIIIIIVIIIIIIMVMMMMMMIKWGGEYKTVYPCAATSVSVENAVQCHSAFFFVVIHHSTIGKFGLLY